MGTETTKYRVVLDDRLSPAMRKALKAANAFDNKLKVIDKDAKKAGKSLSRAFGGFAIKAGIVAGITLITKSIITMGAEMEQTRLTYQTLLGDAAQGNKLMSDLIQLAAVTPLQTEQVLRASRQLLAFGFAANEVEGTIRRLGDISVATGSDLQLFTRNFAQIKTLGRLVARDLWGMTNAGFNPLNEIIKRTGETMEQAMDRMTKGGISFKEVEQAVIDATSATGRFGGIMEKSSKTLIGRWSTLVSNIKLSAATMGESVTTSLGNAVKSLNDFVVDQSASMMQAFSVVTEGIGNVMSAVTRMFKQITGATSGTDAWVEMLSAVGFAFATIGNTIALVIDELTVLGTALSGVASFAMGNFGEGMALFSEAGAMQEKAFSRFGENLAASFLASVKPIVAPEEDNTVLGGSGKVSGLGTGVDGAGAKSGSVSGIQSKVRNITINIENMVREIVFESGSIESSEAKLVDMVKRALLTAVNDVNIIAR